MIVQLREMIQMDKVIFWTMFVAMLVIWCNTVMLMWMVPPIIFQHFLIGIMLYGLSGFVIYHAYHMTVTLYEIYKEDF